MNAARINSRSRYPFRLACLAGAAFAAYVRQAADYGGGVRKLGDEETVGDE